MTVSLYLYGEPVLETYWTDPEAARVFAERAFPRRVVMAILIWRGEGKALPETAQGWSDPDLLFFVAKRDPHFFHLQNSDNVSTSGHLAENVERVERNSDQ